jgi:hypothetical protein
MTAIRQRLTGRQPGVERASPRPGPAPDALRAGCCRGLPAHRPGGPANNRRAEVVS